VNRHAVVIHIVATTLGPSLETLADRAPRLHAAVRDVDVVVDSDATASIAYDGERLHLGRIVDNGILSTSEGRDYALAIAAELIIMDAVERTGTRDARTWNAACMMVAVASLRMSGAFTTPARCAPFDVPMYDGMKPSSLYDRLVELDKAPRRMVGLMTMDDL
jgi:hypothetical protein